MCFVYRELVGTLGKAGEVNTETKGILIENDVDDSEFTEEVCRNRVLDIVLLQEQIHIYLKNVPIIIRYANI